MKWFYFIQNSWREDGNASAQTLLLRAIEDDSKINTKEISVSKIVEITFFAMDYFFQLEDHVMKNDPDCKKIYFDELEKKEYYWRDLKPEKDEKEYMLRKVEFYLKADKFDKETLLYWAKTCMSIWGFPFRGFKETDIFMFPETNAILNLFSLENISKYEDKFGKKWWEKKDDDKKSKEDDKK